MFVCRKQKANRMNKKSISATNPYGVKYPEALTADGKIIYAINLEKGQSDCKGVHLYAPGCEGDEKEEMLFVQRGITKFFRHKPGYNGDKDEQDRYLHNYSERRLKQRFDESEGTGQFMVEYHVLEICPHFNVCKLKSKIKCQGEPKLHLKQLNLRNLYDTCSIEKGENKYIADLLLTNSKDSFIKPMLIEVFVTHECTKEKIKSGYQIIEIKIEKNDDAENDIKENAGELIDQYQFMSPENARRIPPIKFYGFDQSIEFTKYKTYGNFMLTKIGDNLVANYKEVTCDEIKDDTPQNLVFNLLIPIDELKEIDPYEIGLAKAFDMGFRLRDCTLCSRYKIPVGQNNRIDARSCRFGNKTYTFIDNNGREQQIHNPYICWLPYRGNGFDKSQEAARCHAFYIDRQRISNIVKSLENMSKLMWIDESLLPAKPIEQPIAKSNPQISIIDSKLNEAERKLVTAQECFSCPIYRDCCGHCLGAEYKNGRRYVVCDWKRPR